MLVYPDRRLLQLRFQFLNRFGVTPGVLPQFVQAVAQFRDFSIFSAETVFHTVGQARDAIAQAGYFGIDLHGGYPCIQLVEFPLDFPLDGFDEGK